MRIVIMLFLLVIMMGVNGQDTLSQFKYKTVFYEAEQLLASESYIEAIDLYKKLLVGKEDNANLNFKIGYCYLNDKFDKTKSLKYLEKSIKSVSEEYKYEDDKEIKAPIDAYYYLGEALHYNYNFEQAIFNYNKFKSYLTKQDEQLIKKVDKRIDECNTGLKLIEYPVKMVIRNLGENINSKYDEHSPVISADESVLLFTSKRKIKGNTEEHTDGQYFENVYESKNINDNWTEAEEIKQNKGAKVKQASNWALGLPVFNVENQNLATISLSVDGQTLYLYSDKNNNGNIYESKLENEKWTDPEPLASVINSKYKESHASISPEQDILYFTSDRPDGFGGLDIYMSKKLPNGKWGLPQNLGPEINTEYDEESPYIHADGVSLFYSSKGKGSMGGYDIFLTSLEDGKWTERINMGYPINTTGDDVFYVPTPDGQRAYYSSFNKDGFGGSDIYMISLQGAKEKALTVYSGQILMCNGKPPEGVFITVSDIDTDEEIGMYTPNATTGKFLFILKAGKKYKVNVEADNDLSYSEIVDVSTDDSYNKIKKAIVLKPVVFTGEKETFYAAFGANSKVISKDINTKIDSITSFIKNHPKFYVAISDNSKGEDGNYNSRKEALIKKIKNISPNANVLDLKDVPPCANVVNLIIKNSNTPINNDINMPVGVTPVGGVLVINYVLFGFDKYETNEYNNNLNIVASYLSKDKNIRLKIIGYTDAQGNAEYNMILSKKRANFVKKYLINKGVSENQIVLDYKGMSNQISKNLNPESRKFNRRVEFSIIEAGSEKIKIEKPKILEKYKL